MWSEGYEPDVWEMSDDENDAHAEDAYDRWRDDEVYRFVDTVERLVNNETSTIRGSWYYEREEQAWRDVAQLAQDKLKELDKLNKIAEVQSHGKNNNH